MKKYGANVQSGFSLIELLIVVVVLGILVTLAVLQLGTSSQNLERQNIAREFKVSLERARFDSVKRRAENCTDMSRVTITSPTSFEWATDMDQDGSLSANEVRRADFGGRGDVMMVGAGITFPPSVTIRFDNRGQARLDDCSTPAPTDIPLMYFCNGVCDESTATAENSNVIFISRTGTVAMMTGDSTSPVFDAPDVSVVDNVNGVNPMLAIWEEIAASPSPSVSPTASPTESPTGTPTPTPTPTVTPTPTGTPIYCNLGVVEGTGGCVCQPGHYKQQGSGKCREAS